MPHQGPTASATAAAAATAAASVAFAPVPSPSVARTSVAIASVAATPQLCVLPSCSHMHRCVRPVTYTVIAAHSRRVRASARYFVLVTCAISCGRPQC